MSDHHSTPTHPKARKEHRCIYCGGPILAGEQYVQQTGIYRFHAECYDDCASECNYYGEWEFFPYNAPYPERVQAIVDARNTLKEMTAKWDEPIGGIETAQERGLL